MRFYTKQHRHYCGIDLHARSMCLCILDQAGEVLLHKNFRVNPEAFLKAVANYREDPVVAVRRCAPPATCSGDASTSRGNAPSCSLTSRMPTASTICRYSRRSSPTHPTGARPRDVTVPGIGKILSLAILYEIHDIERLKRPQELASYSRLVSCSRESAGKVSGRKSA